MIRWIKKNLYPKIDVDFAVAVLVVVTGLKYRLRIENVAFALNGNRKVGYMRKGLKQEALGVNVRFVVNLSV